MDPPFLERRESENLDASARLPSRDGKVAVPTFSTARLFHSFRPFALPPRIRPTCVGPRRSVLALCCTRSPRRDLLPIIKRVLNPSERNACTTSGIPPKAVSVSSIGFESTSNNDGDSVGEGLRSLRKAGMIGEFFTRRVRNLADLESAVRSRAAHLCWLPAGRFKPNRKSAVSYRWIGERLERLIIYCLLLPLLVASGKGLNIENRSSLHAPASQNIPIASSTYLVRATATIIRATEMIAALN